MTSYIHIGEEIRNYLAAQKRSVAWLANQLGCDPSCLRKSLKNSYMTTDSLFRISMILGNDFFNRYSQLIAENTYRATFTR